MVILTFFFFSCIFILLSQKSNQSAKASSLIEDLNSALDPLVNKFLQSPFPEQIFETNFEQVIDTISLIINNHAPLQTLSRKRKRPQQKPWITKGLLVSMKNKQKLYRDCFLNGNDSQKRLFKIYSNKLTRVKNLSKKLYYHDEIIDRKNNPKELWKFINSVIRTNKSATSTVSKLSFGDDIVKDPAMIPECFNKYFVEIGQSIANNVTTNPNSDFKSYLTNSVSQSIYLELTQPVEIFNIINSLHPYKACGYDDISAYFLRLGNIVLAPVLTVYYNYALERGIFPQIFKIAKVIPIFKSGKKDQVSNYRPISLLPNLSKILEKLIKTRFVNFFERHEILYKYQYGFRQKHSVIHTLLDVTSLSYDAIQNKQSTAFLLMDLRKAFDTVSHKKLLHKLYHHGIRGPAYDLIASYLSFRHQFVAINNEKSTLMPINIGVPQGSILGPLLFLVYVNDLPNATNCQPRLFADGTCLVISSPTISTLSESCNQELQCIKRWCDANSLQINPAKSLCLFIPSKLRSPCPDLQIYYNDSRIECNDACKYLGVIIDSELNFRSHLHVIETKIAKGVGLLSRLRYFFPTSTLLLLYYALVHPHLVYGLPLWGCTFPSYLQKLQILQNKALRLVSNTKNRS